ncbi:MAG: hypothetical protein ACLQFR_21915 [Streptosporangiaceae bacterium]
MTGPNGQAADRDIALACRAASRQLYAAATAAHDLADSLLHHGPWPTMAAEINDLAVDLRDLARQVAILTRQRERDNQNNERKDDQ